MVMSHGYTLPRHWKPWTVMLQGCPHTDYWTGKRCWTSSILASISGNLSWKCGQGLWNHLNWRYGMERPSPQLVLKGAGGLLSRCSGCKSFTLSLQAQSKWANSRESLPGIISSYHHHLSSVSRRKGPKLFCPLPKPQSLSNTLEQVLIRHVLNPWTSGTELKTLYLHYLI